MITEFEVARIVVIMFFAGIMAYFVIDYLQRRDNLRLEYDLRLVLNGYSKSHNSKSVNP